MSNWMDSSIETSRLCKGHLNDPVRGPFDLVLWAIALEALVAFAKFAVRLIGLVCFHPVALVCFVTSYNAASCRSQNPVMSSNMPSDATDGSAFKTALCLRRRNCCQSKKNGRASYKRFHFSLQKFISR